MGFECQRCGWCCRNIVINVAHSDIIRWLNEGRVDILREVSFIDNYRNDKGKDETGFYIAKTAFNPKQPCPFLVDGVCGIHDTSPVACKDFPLASKEMPDCPAFEEQSEDIRDKIKKRQYEDYKKAYLERAELLKIITMARRV